MNLLFSLKLKIKSSVLVVLAIVTSTVTVTLLRGIVRNQQRGKSMHYRHRGPPRLTPQVAQVYMELLQG